MCELNKLFMLDFKKQTGVFIVSTIAFVRLAFVYSSNWSKSKKLQILSQLASAELEEKSQKEVKVKGNLAGMSHSGCIA